MAETSKRRPGRPLKADKSDTAARTEVRLSPDLRRRVRMAAAAADVAMGEWVRRAIEEKLERGDSST